MRQTLVSRLLNLYALKQATLLEAEAGYRNRVYSLTNAGNRLALIVYKPEPDILQRINNAHYTAQHLHDRGLPVRVPADPRIAQIKGKKLAYAALYAYLPGTTIPWEAYTMEHIKQLGGMMSDMHDAVRHLSKGNLPLVTDGYLATCQRMQAYFGQSGVRSALKHKLGLRTPKNLNSFVGLLADLSKASGQQPLHMDFVRGNILFAEGEKTAVTGILDFEKTAWGVPVFDIARTLAFLLVDCKYKEEAKVRKYFLLSGYNKRGQSHFSDWQTLEQLLDLFLTYDFYKFLRHNPYEHLEQNEHFLRTRDFLLKRNILRRIEMVK